MVTACAALCLVATLGFGLDDVELNEKLRDELVKMKEADQAIHKQLIKDGGKDQKLIKEMRDLSRKHTTRLKQIVKEHGWPSPALVGDEGVAAAFAVLQHSEHDRAFQKQCLGMLEKAYKKMEITAGYFAALTDYLRVAERRKQVYGTQFKMDVKTGELTLYPIEDEKNVDKRRADLGLPSLEDYKEMMKEKK